MSRVRCSSARPAGAGTWTTIGTATGSPYQVSWDTTGVADGLYDLRVVTTDNVGNTTTSATVANVRVDNTAPTGSLTAPAASATCAARRHRLVELGRRRLGRRQRAVPALARRRRHLDDDRHRRHDSPYSVSWDTTAVADGLYDLRVVTTDNAGTRLHLGDSSRTSASTTRNPTGSITAPAAGANVRGCGHRLVELADGGSGVASAVFQRSPAGAGTWTTIATDSGPYQVSWDTTAVSDGLYDLRVTTTDNAGNFYDLSALIANVRVDNAAPANSVSLTAATSAT